MHAPPVAEFKVARGFSLPPLCAVPQAPGALLLAGTRCRVTSPARAAPAACMDSSARRTMPSGAFMAGVRPA